MASNNNSSDSSTSTSETSSAKKDEVLTEILTCGICLNRMTSPCCLHCGHGFCRQCLLDYAKSQMITRSSDAINLIRCPYCKYQVEFHSIEHLQSILIISPILNQLCEVLDGKKSNGDGLGSSNSRKFHARCHSCCLLKLLKVCKHCSFMLCESCRQNHLLDVHQESSMQLSLIESQINAVNEKRLELEEVTRAYLEIDHDIRTFADQCCEAIMKQRDRALQLLNERQLENENLFWNDSGFENQEKLEFFTSLVEIAKSKLGAKNITDRELIELAENLQTAPDVDVNSIRSIRFTSLSLELDQAFTQHDYIRLNDHKEKQSFRHVDDLESEKEENLDEPDRPVCSNS